jgi:hypothetical protein
MTDTGLPRVSLRSSLYLEEFFTTHISRLTFLAKT